MDLKAQSVKDKTTIDELTAKMAEISLEKQGLQRVLAETKRQGEKDTEEMERLKRLLAEGEMQVIKIMRQMESLRHDGSYDLIYLHNQGILLTLTLSLLHHSPSPPPLHPPYPPPLNVLTPPSTLSPHMSQVMKDIEAIESLQQQLAHANSSHVTALANANALSSTTKETEAMKERIKELEGRYDHSVTIHDDSVTIHLLLMMPSTSQDNNNTFLIISCHHNIPHDPSC